MQIDGEHSLQPMLPILRAHRPFFVRFPASPSLHSPSHQNLRPFRHVAIARTARDGSSMHVDDMAGQHWGPATRSVFFRGDIGGETQGIQRFQLLEGVE